jgi:hypothetical protein
MYNLLAEQPLLVSIMLAALAGGMLAGWLQSGNKAVAIIAIVVLCLIPAAWMIADRIETDRERISRIIYETASAIEANDHQRAVSVIDDEDTRRRALLELPKYVFDMAEVNKINRIVVSSGVVPITADVELIVKADVSAKRGGFNNLRVLRKLELGFEKRGNHWVVVNYQHSPVIGSGP